MGRSKFPGKPSKHVNRKRINVLPPATDGIIESGGPMTVETVAENKQGQESANDGENESIDSNNVVNNKVLMKRRLNRKMQNSKVLMSNNTTKRSLITKIKTAKTKIQHYSSVKTFKQCRKGISKESNNIVGKFVLPTRSVHSSRVIKPNKRFINVDLSDTLTMKKRSLGKRHCVNLKQEETNPAKKCTNDSDESAPVVESSAKTFSNGRIVLRQARLKLHNQTPSGAEGPFSCKTTINSPPGTVTCGVCGAVRFYRFVKQARKFNIYSCESCRKFISKMIKRQSCGKNVNSATLVCHKGQGMCHVPPIVRSQQMKLIRCAYKSRCPACWLKMCLRFFQMPLSLKNSLIQLLPKNMQSSDVIFNNTLPLLWQGPQKTEEQPEAIKQRPVRFKTTKPPVSTNLIPSTNSNIKRQKIDLKGPRVKHVCRSASIVLGQPLATFSASGDTSIEKKSSEIVKEHMSESKKTEIVKNIVPSISWESKEVSQISKTLKDVNNSSENELSDSDKLLKLPMILNDNIISHIKRDKSQRVPFSNSSTSSSSPSSSSSPLTLFDTKSSSDKKPFEEFQNMIKIDYWENYDLDDISQNGFCLIASQQFPMPAICFLCGSAGREALLHCSLCCEPYHPFCLEQCPPISNNNNRQFMWLCPRCTTCSGCNQTDRQKLNCQKCSKAYHSECFNTKWNSNGKPSVCSKCLTCRSCGDCNTTKFFGNLPLCNICFKLRKKGNYCPVCQRQYDEMDFDAKVMECTKCKKLIHAECEGLSEEYYYMLSILPESIKYLCNLCSQQSIPYWRKAVESELKFNFNLILRLLSKNKTAKNVLKLSPLNNRVALAKTITTVKKIYFSDEENEESMDVSDFNKITQSQLNLPTEMKFLTMLDIKSKLNTSEYNSVRDFNRDMEEALNHAHTDEIVNIYRSILQSVFPWFKPATSNEDEWKSVDCLMKQFFNKHSIDEEVCDQIECVAIDSRYCSFCKSIGDGLSHLESRLLYCGQNEWVHINCALWSSEVYEEIDGSLQNVHSALSRGRMVRCSYCKQKGATVGCCFKNCFETYHFICARTAKCHFMHDKTVYCSNHELPKNSSIIVNSTDFNIRRSVFVEMSDSKRGKFSQIDKVNVMVGSLCVTNLGKINPILSDSTEAIIPTGYSCSRLFWSTVEPWKLVPYKISTSIINSYVNNLYIDKNFTVDHTLPKSVVERKMREILLWHKELDKKKSDIFEFEDEEEPQSSADLLSPEITDAIFEELPHELLDGISVQDIFPKLSYEDFINLDSSDSKKSEQDLEEIEESKNKNSQRSCSLTLSCKLDNSFSPVMKKRKITPRDNMCFQLLQVDGNFDDSSSDCGSPISTENISSIWEVSEEPVTCERCHCTYRTQASYKRHLESCEMICSSESDSEINQEQENINIEAVSNSQVNIMESSTVVMNVSETAQPVIYESYQNEIHTSMLNSHTFVTSKATSEVISMPQQNPEIIIPQIAKSTEVANTFTESVGEFVCVNPGLALQQVNPPMINQPITPIQFGHQTLQSLPYSNNVTPIINVAPQNQITFTDKLLNNSNIINFGVSPSADRWIKHVDKTPAKPQFKTKMRGRSIAVKNNDNETIIIPQSNPVIVQHLPSTNFIPTFVDTFHQQPSQNVQYVTTITPQQHLMQFQSDNNLISLLPGMQPTMIIQQPRVLENQLILDSNGSLSWAPQPVQPMYYGFETIVQNTVMQSQQFLPSTVPGILTANSSYSTTTQVFQTSKLEPVLDVAAATNSFVLVNSGQLINQQTIEAPSQPINTLTNIVQNTEVASKYSTPPAFQKPTNINNSNITSTFNSNSITLPTAPFVPEQGIPTNIVTPTPKSITTAQTRPMNRVLPMQTIKEVNKRSLVETSEQIRKETKIVTKPEPLIEVDKPLPPPVEIEIEKKVEKSDPSLKLIFQKQIEDGSYKVEKPVNISQPPPPPPPPPPSKPKSSLDNSYKINNNFVNNKSVPVQVAPLKPIKSNVILPLSEKQNRQESNNKIEKKIMETLPTKHYGQEKKENENIPAILYTIETQDGFKYSSTSVADLWTKVFEAVQNARAAHNMPLLPPDSTNIMNSLQILGLKTSGLKYLIEQLPGATKCTKYRPTFNFPSKFVESEDELIGHSSGCARCAPHCKRNEPYDMFGWLASIHRKPEHSLICADLFPRRSSVNNLPMAMRFRQLKLTSKYSVGVYRSKIHRRGLFCLRDFEAGEMVIEYSGEVIRSILTDKRERCYNSKGIGCYMFRIDDNLVVDATMTGNAARFINHSCDPNCYSKVVEILGHKHIIIFALRRIICGEELTYDYKFPIEEDKIPCTCGARRCRKFLN